MSGNWTVKSISDRLSLRTPQRRSLEILERIVELAPPKKGNTPEQVLEAIRGEFLEVKGFERAFPNLCFSLATGVGKTRLMGAFIAYLHLTKGLRNFFVLAPNLTIYNKLVVDFTPNTPKYVFQGINAFAVKAPSLVTGENFEQKPQKLELFETDDVIINVFNISKFNTRTEDSRKIRRLSEYLGQSYFDYLAGLDDLVMIMDEAHRYRADSSMKSIEELKPLLGLELTATPQIESGSKAPVPFKNVIYSYSLAQAMVDGYVKEPAVATRANFIADKMAPSELEKLKLEDGIRVHESTKVELEVYAQQNEVRKVKPFMLVVASDTDHATALVQQIESEDFFGGQYKGKVIQVHSGQKGAEKDENVERLLAVEKQDEPTEIVVHVNMLKEGWDVTNLYTIVPLRAANSRTLVEQSIGRGLRLPYGKKTGVPAVDRLTIIAHDRFNEIVEEAKKGGYSFSKVTIDEEIPEKGKQTVTASPTLSGALGIPAANAPALPGAAPVPVAPPQMGTKLGSPENQAAVQLTLEAIHNAAQNPKVPGLSALTTEDVQQMLVREVSSKLGGVQLPMYPTPSDKDLLLVVKEVVSVYVNLTIAIPRVLVLPTGEVKAGFNPFKLDLSSFHMQPVASEILIHHLKSNQKHTLGVSDGAPGEERLEDYVVRGLIDFDDIDYNEQSALLYDLAEQVVKHLQGYLDNDEAVRNVLLFYQRQIVDLVHGQMKQHSWEKASSYKAVVSQGYSELKAQAFSADKGEGVRPFNVPVEKKADIRKMLFGGFRKCLYQVQKFDSDPERRFAEILEDDSTVQKWLKPAPGMLKIRYSADHEYEPDFVVETTDRKLLCEAKRADQMQDPIVQAKALAASTWCKHATEHELKSGGKPWGYLLIPHDVISSNMTISGLAKNYTVKAP